MVFLSKVICIIHMYMDRLELIYGTSNVIIDEFDKEKGKGLGQS